MKRRLYIPLGAAAAILLVAAIIIWSIFGSMISTVRGIERIDDTQLFTMEYQGDYSFDKFLTVGASSDAELVDFVVTELTHGIPLEFELPDLSCTTFVAETAEGNALMGRNFDMYYSPVMLVKTTPDNGYRSLSMVNLAFLGYGSDYLPETFSSGIVALAAPYAPMDGMNEKGLAVSVMLIDTVPTDQQTDKIDITTSSAIRLLLDKAATVDEAVALLQQYDMHSSASSCYHFLIADANGDSAVVEYVDDQLMVLYGEKASTNFLLTEGEYDFGSGYGRYAKVQTTLAENDGVLSREQAMDLLESCNYNGAAEALEKGEEYIPDDTPTSTQWSCVYDLDALTVDIAVGADWSNIYTYSLLDW